MSKIHFFPRFTSKENTVTNNTLLLFARIYDHSPERASKLLTDLSGAPIEIGLEIGQQQKVGNAIPDGTLIQRSFKILLETKVDAKDDEAQLLRHCLSFSEEETQILLLLTKQHISRDRFNKFKKSIASQSPKVIFQNITFEEICKSCDGLFSAHEFQMQSLVDDYAEYCNDAKLFDQSPYLLRIVPCGQSIALNEKYSMYFHPADKGYTKHRFEGIYTQRCVHFLLDLEEGSVFDIDSDGVKILSRQLVEGVDTDKYDKKILAMIGDAKKQCGYDIAKGHRFFCGELCPTSFRKSSPGGIQGNRLIDLRKIVGEFSDVADAAEKLKANTWE